VVRNVSYVFAILLGLAAAQVPDTHPRELTGPPSVNVLLPPSIPSENIRVAYNLVGPFGAYGAYTDLESGLHSYEIGASVNGKAATEARVIMYAPGCDIQTFAIPLQADSTVTEDFECEHVPTVSLSGQVVPSELLRNKGNTELVVDYMAPWGDKFFNIYDGMVPDFKVAAARLDADGRFQVKLPYFTVDSKGPEPESSFHLTLCDAGTGNLIASNLEPELSDFASETHQLEIRPFYPAGLRFQVQPSESPEPLTDTPDNGPQP
jgi:hypothetical protein